ncbi:ATP-binding protein [Streptomyces sp. NPDC047123]|uniref:ATP-binding protein n=1 Tax=Streptomyces sp. NPDC047123 TaxID=3155622 RepID=UPI003406A218
MYEANTHTIETAGTVEVQDISCADARSTVRSALADGGAQASRRLLEDALLVISELAANAILHAGGITSVSARLTVDELVLEVSDSSRVTPRSTSSAAGTPGGHGWTIIHRLCARVDVDVTESGKTITAVLALPH